MKVCLIHNVVSPYRLPLFEELQKRYDLTVLFCRRSNKSRGWDESLSGYHFKAIVLRAINVPFLVFNPTIFRELMGNHYDVYIVANNEENYPTIFLTALYAKLHRKPLIIWEEHTLQSSAYARLRREKFGIVRVSLSKILFGLIQKLIYALGSAFLSMSYAKTDEYIESLGVHAASIFSNTQVMPDTLLKGDIDPNFNLMAQRQDYKYLLYLGYMRIEKNLDSLIRAFNIAHGDTDGKWKLVLAGVGPEEQKLKKLARSNQDIFFVGYTQGQRKIDLFAHASVFVLPSLYEPWGMVVNESLYYGTPVICTTDCGSSELITQDVNGWKYDAENLEQLTNYFKTLFSEPSSLKRLTRGAEQYDRKKLSSPRNGVRHFIKAIERVTSQTL